MARIKQGGRSSCFAAAKGPKKSMKICYAKPESMSSKLERLEKVAIEKKKSKNFSNSFGKLLFSGAASDISVKVGEETFHAHKMILCMRSDVFTAMFGMPLSESTSNEVSITDFRASTVKNLLKYLYTDEFDSELTMLQALDLIAIGDKYQIENIQEDCLSFMARKVSSLNELEPFKEIAVVAKEHGLSAIADKALDRIIDLFPFAFPKREADDGENEEEEDGDEDDTSEPNAKKQRVIETSTDCDKTTTSSALLASEHYSLFTSLGPELYFQLVERAVREAQEKRQSDIDEAEE